MKDLITAVGSILILMVLILQMAGNQAVYTKMIKADMAVDNFRETARIEGCVSEENAAYLKKQLEEICGSDSGEIKVDGTKKTRKAGQLIEYEIEYYIDDIIVMNHMLNITDEENRVRFCEDSGVISAFYEIENENEEK